MPRHLQMRAFMARAVAVFLVAMTMFGHLVALLLGAADAYLTALVGLPRLGYKAHQFAQVVRETWEEDLRRKNL